MTRELLFFNNFETQFGEFSGWRSLAEQRGVKDLAPGDYPGFEVTPGEARYTEYDTYGHPYGGEQDFTLRIVFAHPQCAFQPVRTMHAEFVSLVEQFFTGGYISPTLDLSDRARINGITLLKIESPVTNKIATHTTIIVRAQYSFTLI